MTGRGDLIVSVLVLLGILGMAASFAFGIAGLVEAQLCSIGYAVFWIVLAVFVIAYSAVRR